ncbi:MAG TPA: hypothetical protein PKD86_13265 [Gemmatales bacterium]|nr:hypothetical protein [Gemmatales bacterium]HMP60310.1 hypothetical protein [Gemmatales bacterium]
MSQNEFSERYLNLVTTLLDQAVHIFAGGVTYPLLMLEDAIGTRDAIQVQTATGKVDAGLLDKVRDMVVELQRPDTLFYAFAYDVFLTQDGVKRDAVMVEAGERGMPKAYLFAQCYEMTDAAELATLVGQPLLVDEAAQLLSPLADRNGTSLQTAQIDPPPRAKTPSKPRGKAPSKSAAKPKPKSVAKPKPKAKAGSGSTKRSRFIGDVDEAFAIIASIVSNEDAKRSSKTRKKASARSTSKTKTKASTKRQTKTKSKSSPKKVTKKANPKPRRPAKKRSTKK